MKNYNLKNDSLSIILEQLGGGAALYHKMIDEISDYAMLLLDVDGNILNWNKGALNIKGYTSEEIVGKNFRMFYTLDDLNAGLPEQLLSEAIQNGKAVHDGWRVKKDGWRFWGSVLITPLHDAEQNVIAFSKITRDLSEKRAAEEKQRRHASELEHKNQELERSEAIYSSMIAEVSDYAIILLDSSGQIMNWNKGAEKIKGYAAAEIVGKNFSQFYLQEDIQNNLPQILLNEAKQEGSAKHEGWRVKKEGTVFWGSVVITALHDDQDAIIGYSKVTRDLTERKMAEEQQNRIRAALQYQNQQLKLSEERYHRMIAEVEDYAIISLDINGNILNWNKGAQKIKGYTESEINRKHFSIFYFDEDIETQLPWRLLSEAAKNDKATHEGWRKRKDGTRFWGSVVITALHNALGEVTGFSKVTRDLTHQKEVEDFINYQNKQLEEFAYVASHDLQEPLRKILTFGSILETQIADNVPALVTLNKINHSAHRMSQLIHAILTYSQIKVNEGLIEEVNITQVIAGIENDFELLLKEKNGRLIYNTLPIIQAVPIQMHQLFVNLISNAIKFNNGAPEIHIDALPILQGNHPFVRFTISDNGIGFDSKFKDRIFGMFNKLPTGKPGTGIGLALCKRIVENHHGSIGVDSTIDIGTTFTISLPVTPL